jgi:predicted RNA-binding protein YlqC (UPF0109 family)
MFNTMADTTTSAVKCQPPVNEERGPGGFLLAMLGGIVPRPHLLRVEEETAGDVTVLTIHLPADDRRFVVGKGGKNIEAIRHLLRAYAGRQGQMIVAKLPDEGPIPEEPNEQSRRQCRS